MFSLKISNEYRVWNKSCGSLKNGIFYSENVFKFQNNLLIYTHQIPIPPYLVYKSLNLLIVVVVSITTVLVVMVVTTATMLTLHVLLSTMVHSVTRRTGTNIYHCVIEYKVRKH